MATRQAAKCRRLMSHAREAVLANAAGSASCLNPRPRSLSVFARGVIICRAVPARCHCREGNKVAQEEKVRGGGALSSLPSARR